MATNQTNEATLTRQSKSSRPTLKKVADRTWKDSDGFWILLKDGFHIDGVHAIREDTKRAAIAQVKNVRPCACIDCAAAKAAR